MTDWAISVTPAGTYGHYASSPTTRRTPRLTIVRRSDDLRRTGIYGDRGAAASRGVFSSTCCSSARLREKRCQATRQGSSPAIFSEVPGPVLTSKANNQHPAARVVYDGEVGYRLLRDSTSHRRAGPRRSTGRSFAIKADNGTVCYGYTAAGASPISPAPLTRQRRPLLLANAPVLFAPLNSHANHVR